MPTPTPATTQKYTNQNNYGLIQCPELGHRVTGYECCRRYESGVCAADCPHHGAPSNRLKNPEQVTMTDGRPAIVSAPTGKAQGRGAVLTHPDTGAIIGRLCDKCGTPKPLDQFHRAAGCVAGRRGTCKSCVNQYYREKYAVGGKGKDAGAKKSKSGPKPAAATNPAAAPEKTAGPHSRPAWTPDYALLLDFEDHPQLLKGLETLAAHNFRTPAKQILYMIQDAMGFVPNI